MPDIGVGNDGWDFLSRPMRGEEDTYSDDSGGWGYRESDGSGSFRGSDGSWGYRDADGSGSYHGSDGTWGSWDSDGSFSYHGGDGAWGHSDPDGSGSFHGADGSYSYWGSDGSYRITDRSGNSRYGSEDDELTYIDLVSGSVEGSGDDSDSSVSSYVSNFVSNAVQAAFGIKAPANEDDEEDEEDEEDEDERAYLRPSSPSWRSSSGFRETESPVEKARREEIQRRRQQEAREKARQRRAALWAFLRKHWRGCIKATLALSLLLLVGIVYCEYRMLTPIGYGSSDLVGKNVGKVHSILENAGFSRITDEALCDLSANDAEDANLVSGLRLMGPDEFSDSWQYPSNLPITIEYHSFRLVHTPLSARDAREKPYKEIVKEFENAGFEKIEVEAAHDLILGVLHKEGTVASVSIGGERKFDSGDTFEVCDTVLIKYHSPAFG